MQRGTKMSAVAINERVGGYGDGKKNPNLEVRNIARYCRSALSSVDVILIPCGVDNKHNRR